MTKLQVSADLSLPEDAVTRTFVVYGGKGKGKTNFGAVLTEELDKRHLRFCVTDPLDVWWGLQHGKTKDGVGIDVVILGGAHGDIKIHPGAGELIADFVADETVSTVIVMRHADGKMWTSGERIRFMAAFVRRIFARQGEKRLPLMLVIDEAGRFVPQNPGKGDIAIAECIGAIEELVEWGRNVGIGCCLITQRSARMNKSVSELAECMVAFQTAGPKSIAAIVEWFGEHIPRERQNELIETLRQLPVGRALVVSPEWLHFEGEAQIRLRETFDSSATPKAGGALRAPGKARKPDLAKYEARMTEVVERAKADDPAELRKQLAAAKKSAAAVPDLTADLATARARIVELEKRPPKALKPDPMPILKKGELKVLGAVSEKWLRIADTMLKAEVAGRERVEALRVIAGELADAIAPVRDELHKITSAPSAAATTSGDVAAAAVRTDHTRQPIGRATADEPPAYSGAERTTRGGSSITGRHRPTEERGRSTAEAAGSTPAPRSDADVTAAQQRILDVAAQLAAIGVDDPRRELIAGLAKMSPRSSTFGMHIAALLRAGYLETAGVGALRLTELGRANSNAADAPSSSRELQARIYEVVGGPRARILEALVEAYPGILTRDELAERAGASATSSTFGMNVSDLAQMGFATYPDKGYVKAADVLFLEAA